MKKLNQYILEKLKIDKHVNIEPEIIFEKMLFLLYMRSEEHTSELQSQR